MVLKRKRLQLILVDPTNLHDDFEVLDGVRMIMISLGGLPSTSRMSANAPSLYSGASDAAARNA
jgi:hypothetical protein